MITHHISPDPLRTDCAQSPLAAGQYSRDWAKVTCADCLARRTNDRDELAQAIVEHQLCRSSHATADRYDVWVTCRCGWKSDLLPDGNIPTVERAKAMHSADAILAAGYRKPRTVITAEERQALDPLAVVMWIDDAGLPHAAVAAAVQSWTNSERHPMTVLWTPEVDQ